MKYAPEGYVYMSVVTPSVFDEIKVREEDDDRTDAEKQEVERLALLAERYQTNITRTTYSLAG